MSTKAASLTYYDFSSMMGRNGVYNFLVGARGLGKTYGAKLRVIRNAINKGQQFIYMRRYETELHGRSSFFADIAHVFPEWEFRVVGHTAEMRKAGTDKWRTIGYFIPLSKAQSKKSVSNHDVTVIIYDEFIIDKGSLHYLPNEADLFNDFYSTVDRYRDKTRVFFLANAVSIMNPYFIRYRIRPANGQEWYTAAKGFIVAHFARSDDFAGEVYSTKFGAFIKGTTYADYAVESGFRDNTENMLGKKTPESDYYATIETSTGAFSLWIDQSSSPIIYYIQEKLPKQQRVLTLLPQTMTSEKTYVTRSDRLLQLLRSSFAKGLIKFDSPQARESFIGVFA